MYNIYGNVKLSKPSYKHFSMLINFPFVASLCEHDCLCEGFEMLKVKAIFFTQYDVISLRHILNSEAIQNENYKKLEIKTKITSNRIEIRL